MNKTKSLFLTALALFTTLVAPQICRAISPGKITFRSSRDGNPEIYVMDADGANQTRLTNNAASDDEPRFSPNASKIVFQSDRDGNFEIYTMNADGTNQVRVTNNAATDQVASFSPDGSRIVFVSNRAAAANFDIYVMNSDGTNVLG